MSGYNPPYYIALVSGLERRDPAVLEALASLGPYDVVVDENADRDGEIARYVSQAPGAARETSDGTRTLFRIPQGPAESALGPTIPIVTVQAKPSGRKSVEILPSSDAPIRSNTT